MVTADVAGQPVLELTGIGKDFGAIRALQGINMRVFPGEVVGLMGDNGAGKSTLVKIIAGNFPATQLELLRDGYSNALTGQRPFEMGEKSMDTLLAIKKGEKVPEIIYTGLDLVTKDNVAQLLK
jgi:ABC-type branched-subunit amino acid transport system ATPase component